MPNVSNMVIVATIHPQRGVRPNQFDCLMGWNVRPTRHGEWHPHTGVALEHVKDAVCSIGNGE